MVPAASLHGFLPVSTKSSKDSFIMNFINLFKLVKSINCKLIIPGYKKLPSRSAIEAFATPIT